MRMWLWRYGACALALAAGGVHATSLDELLDKNLQARGGLDAIHAIKTLKASGSLRFGEQFELTFIQFQKAPESSRNEASLQGLTAVQAWDGKQAWQISPFQGRKDPEAMTADDARSLSDDAPIGGPLIDWKTRGSTLAYLGTEDVDGTDAHKIKVTLKNGDIQIVFLDPDHFLEIRTRSQRTVRGTLVESVTDYGDYEQVAGVYFPFSIATLNKADGSEQKLSITKAEANVPMDDALFAFPTTAKGAAK
jgi:hypothetical protein